MSRACIGSSCTNWEAFTRDANIEDCFAMSFSNVTGGAFQLYNVNVTQNLKAFNASSGSATQDFVYVYHDGQLIAQQNPDGTRYYIGDDNKGSTNVVTDGSGAVVEHDTYSPFGERLNASVLKFGYEGKEADTVVGDTDFHARKYRPDLGMFMQPDDSIQNVYDPQSLNRYAFERNNPHKYEDQNGHNPVLIGAVIGFAIGTVGYGYTHQGQGRGSFSNFATYMAKGIGVGLVGGIIGGASAEILTAGGRIVAPAVAEYGALGAFGAAGYYADQKIEGNPIDYGDMLIAGGASMLPIRGFNKGGTFISETRSFAPNSIKFIESYLLNVLVGGAVNAAADRTKSIVENTVQGKPGTQIGTHGAVFDYVTPAGDVYPTSSATFIPRPAGTPGGKGGGSSMGDGGFGSQP